MKDFINFLKSIVLFSQADYMIKIYDENRKLKRQLRRLRKTRGN